MRGRKKKENIEMVRVRGREVARTMLYLDYELYAELKKLAFERSGSMTDLINLAIAEFLKREKEMQEKEKKHRRCKI